MATRCDAAVSAANQLVSIMQQFSNLRQTVNQFVQQYNSEGYSTLWTAWPTAAQNADGSLGAADGTPQASHPLDNRQANIAALQKVATSNQYVNAVAMLMAFQAFLTNQAVATAQRNQNVDDLAS